jgi:hypothetical protein
MEVLTRLFKRVKPVNNNSIIDEIHHTFNTEVDRLLGEAGIKKDISTSKQHIIEKGNKLAALGFKQALSTTEAVKEENRIRSLKIENNSKAELEEAIRHFSFKYPHYKFITEESVKKICEKYNLVYATVDRYIGDVPDKNLKDMENFKIAEEDICIIQYDYSSFGGSERFIGYLNSSQRKIEEEWQKDNDKYRSYCHRSYFNFRKNLLEIAAPLKDFDLKGHEVRNFKLSKIEIPDPVVLQPVVRNNKKYFLIVTAWGQEATDELILNQKNN